MMIYALLVLPALVLAADIPAIERDLVAVLDKNKDNKVSKMEIEDYFMTYDTNMDGKVTAAEFKTGLDKLNAVFINHESVLFNLFDHDKNKSLDRSDIDSVFALGDSNRSGFLEKSELDTIATLAGVLVG